MIFFRFLKSKTFGIQVIIAVIILFVIIATVNRYLHYYTNSNQSIEVPDLKNLVEEEVRIVLDDMDLEYEIIDFATYDPKFHRGAVVQQQPLAGSVVKAHRKIYITLNPFGYSKVAVPYFYGKTKKEIQSLLINAGFRVGRFDTIPDIGTVVRKLYFRERELREGDKLPSNSIVDIIIGSGNAPIDTLAIELEPTNF